MSLYMPAWRREVSFLLPGFSTADMLILYICFQTAASEKGLKRLGRAFIRRDCSVLSVVVYLNRAGPLQGEKTRRTGI
jgi:hypothetical protein